MPLCARSDTLLGTLRSVFFCFGLGVPPFPALVRAGACNGLQLLFSARRWWRRSMSGTKLLSLLEPARHATCSSTTVRRSSHKLCFSPSCEHEVSECRSRSVFRKHPSSREPVPYCPLESRIVPQFISVLGLEVNRAVPQLRRAGTRVRAAKSRVAVRPSS